MEEDGLRDLDGLGQRHSLVTRNLIHGVRCGRAELHPYRWRLSWQAVSLPSRPPTPR